MITIGDQSAGFSAGFDPKAGKVHVRGWGFWTRDIADAFDATVSQVCRSSPRGSPVLIDMSDLKPLREEGQQAFGALVRRLRSLGVGRTAIATSSQLTKLQLLRLVTEHGMKDSVCFASVSVDRTPDAVFEELQKGALEG